jgi:glycosyltransferase involved in cell wall biosynthesis
MARVALIGGFGDLVVKLRGSLIRALRDAGHEVIVCVPRPSAAAMPGVQEGLRDLGARYVEATLDRAGTNPFAEIASRLFYERFMRDERPDAVLAYNPKPVFYAVPAARRAGVPRVAAMITGLGYAFTDRSARARILALLAMRLYRRAIPMADAVIFQNTDNREFFEHAGLLAGARRVVQVPGPGVDLERFPWVPIAEPPKVVTYLFVGRLLRDKGVLDFVEAARALRALRLDHERMRFQIAGFLDSNPACVTPHDVRHWQETGVVEFLGRLQDVRPALAAASVLVLPSRGEGMPMAVLEAMSTGRAVVTSDAPGCRESIEDLSSGYIVPARSVPALAVAMEQFLEDPNLVVLMGRAARERAERVFDARQVCAQVMDAMGLGARSPARAAGR